MISFWPDIFSTTNIFIQLWFWSDGPLSFRFYSVQIFSDIIMIPFCPNILILTLIQDILALLVIFWYLYWYCYWYWYWYRHTWCCYGTSRVLSWAQDWGMPSGEWCLDCSSENIKLNIRLNIKSIINKDNNMISWKISSAQDRVNYVWIERMKEKVKQTKS